MNKRALKEVLNAQKELFLSKKDLFKRDILADFFTKYEKLKEVFLITGVRRCGKSSLMRLIWSEFKKKRRLDDNQFLYVNFEDERLAEFSKDDFPRLQEAQTELFGSPAFIFLDEIQNIPFWEKWINRLYEEGRYKIFITGSNATLLSSELATALTGRNIPITLYPLSFYEYLVYFKKQTIVKTSFYDLMERVKITKALDEYLRLGGMPEYLKTGSTELVQGYFKDIVLRDIAQRYGVRHKRGLSELARLLLANMGQMQTLKNISKNIEVKNLTTIKNYLKYLEDGFLFFHLPIYSHSYKTQLYNPDKYYCVDLAFFENIAFKTSGNAGAVYENAVFLELKRDPRNELFYCKTQKNLEVDFAVKNKKMTELCQVCYDLANPNTKERETKALAAAMDELNIKKGYIINSDIEDIEKTGGKEVYYAPLWKWLLSKHLPSNII